MPADRVEASRTARLVAILTGALGVLLCGLTPLLPVTQTTATVLWPQAPGPDGMVAGITAPLVSGAPQALEVSIPCTAVAGLPPAGGLVFGTNPPDGIDASRNGLVVRATADSVFVAFRDTVAAVAPRAHHWADDPVLRRFVTPDGSHIDKRDRVAFTLALVRYLGLAAGNDSQRPTSPPAATPGPAPRVRSP